MIQDFRNFEVRGFSGDTWKAEFRWLQNGITIRHADTVDVKFFVNDGSGEQEKVIALPHPLLLELSKSTGQQLSDRWCMKLAALHLKRMIETGEDLEKTLVNVSRQDLADHAACLQAAAARTEG